MSVIWLYITMHVTLFKNIIISFLNEERRPPLQEIAFLDSKASLVLFFIQETINGF